MEKRIVLANKHRRHELPFVGTVVWWLVLDRFNAPGWLYGVVFTLAAVVWIVLIVAIFWYDYEERSPVWEQKP